MKKIVATTIILAMVVPIILALLMDLYINIFSNHKTDYSMEKIYFISTVFATLLLAFVAYHQLHSLSDTAKHDFMFKLLSRYQSKEILDAREIIHKISLSVTAEGMPECQRRILISNEILRLKTDTTKPKDFVMLNNLLELMEDISYYANKSIIDIESVVELRSGSISYYHDIFKALMYDRIKKHGDYYYFQFRKFHSDIMSNVSKCQPCGKQTTE